MYNNNSNNGNFLLDIYDILYNRAFIGSVVYSLISVLPNEFLFKSVIIRVPSKVF